MRSLTFVTKSSLFFASPSGINRTQLAGFYQFLESKEKKENMDIQHEIRQGFTNQIVWVGLNL